MKLIYLASPYSDERLEVMQERYEAVRDFTAVIMRETAETGIVPFSPIVHNHDMAVSCDLPKTYEFWMTVDKTLIRHCDELWILQLPGWNKSRGIKMEIAFAEEIMIPVKYILPEYQI